MAVPHKMLAFILTGEVDKCHPSLQVNTITIGKNLTLSY